MQSGYDIQRQKNETKLHRLWKKMLQREIKSVKFVQTCTNTWLPFYFVWQSKKFYSLFLSGVINRLLKCCRQSTLITLISKQIYLLLYLLYSKFNACDWLKKGLYFSKGERIRLNDRYMLKILFDFQLFCDEIFIPYLIKHICRILLKRQTI